MTDVDASGTLVGSARKVIDYTLLKSLVSLPAFNGTLFQRHPPLLRRYMELKLERMDFVKNGVLFYYTLIFPRIGLNSIFPSYNVLQTGFFVEGGHYSFDIPSRVALYGERYMDVICIHAISGLCRVNLRSLKESCLTSTTTCSLKKPDCGDNTCSVNTKHGLLVTTLEELNGFATRTGRLVSIPQSASHVHFLSWTNYTSVHIMGIDGYEESAPSAYTNDYVLKTDEFHINFTAFKAPKRFTSHLEELERKIEMQNKQINNISTIVKDGTSEDENQPFWKNLELMLHAGQIVFFMYLAFQIINCFCTRSKYGKAREGYGVTGTGV